MRFYQFLFFNFLLVIQVWPQSWVSYTSKTGHYTIDFPVPPLEKIQNADTEIGTIPLYMVTAETNSMVFMSSYNQYPNGSIDHTRLDLFYESIKNGALKNSNGILLNEKKVDISGFQGKEFYFKTGQGDEELYLTERIVAVGDRLFQFIVGEPIISADLKSKKRFFNSLKISYRVNLVSSLLADIGYNYDVDQNGQYFFRLEYEDGRKQLVYLTPSRIRAAAFEMVDIWSPVIKFKTLPSDSVLVHLLMENGTVELGAFQLIPVEDGHLLLFGGKFDVRLLKGEEFKSIFHAIASFADESEKILSGNDTY